MSDIISPNMRLPIPTVGDQPGPDYAENINASLTLVDQHDHSPGNGVKITPAGINISSDLTFVSNNATDLRSSRYTPQASALSLPADLGAVYVSGADLYYNDTAGNQVRLTQGGSIVGTAGSITGLPSGTASASFAAGTFTWQSATSTPANMDFASATFRNNLINSKGLTLSPPNAMPADYSLVLPSLPIATSAMLLDSSGNMSTVTYPFATASIATASITAVKLATDAIAGIKSQVFTSSGNFTVPTNVNAVYGVIYSGGGGGGGGTAGAAAGGGGSGGLLWQGWLACTPGDTIAVVVGAGGVGGSSGNNGADGGASSFASFSIPGGPGGKSPGNGGGGGSYAALGVLAASGGQGATAPAGNGAVGTGTFYAPGGSSGGNAGGGGGAGWTSTATGGVGSSVGGGAGGGTNSGSGGGGGGLNSNSTGGAGQAGLVTLYWAGLP